MSARRPAMTSVCQGVWIAVRFVLFGIGGLVTMLLCAVEFALRVLWHDQHMMVPWMSLPLTGIGALMVLFGVGQWGRWAYLWVCFSIPLSLCLLALIPGSNSNKDFMPVLVAVVAACVSYGAVEAYYDRPTGKGTPEHDRTT
jgi:hypothetical protein